jgi:hypothetical protein
MKSRVFAVSLFRHSESLAGGASYGMGKTLCAPLAMVPTVDNVRSVIGRLCPCFMPDERWQSIKEQIADSLEFGFFSVSLRAAPGYSDDEFISYSIDFMEV